jgi:threonine synthase
MRALMGSLAQSRHFAVSSHALKEMRALFTADRADEQESAATIRAWVREAGYCVDPHTAVGLAVAEKEARDPSLPMVVLSTAHPAKFPDAVKAACGVAPALPDWLADLTDRAERVTVLPADQAAVERYVASASRAAREGAAA